MVLQSFGDNFIPVIPVIPVDHKEHTAEHPFCWNPGYPCHEDSDAIAAVNQAVQDGLMTAKEATDYVLGRLLYGGKDGTE